MPPIGQPRSAAAVSLGFQETLRELLVTPRPQSWDALSRCPLHPRRAFGPRTARAYRPDVVVLDIGLPGMSGYDVARQLRQQAEFRRTLLVAMTGYGQEEDRRRSQEAGFDYHMTKPVDPDALQAFVARPYSFR